jgi:hypothetical protein
MRGGEQIPQLDDDAGRGKEGRGEERQKNIHVMSKGE